MSSAAEEFHEDDSYRRKFVLPFLDSRIHFGVRDLGSILHLEGFAQLPDGKEEEFDVIFIVDSETGDFQPTQGFIDHVNRLGEGAFAKAHGTSGALLGGSFRALGGIFNFFYRMLMLFTSFGILARGTTGLVLMILPWALGAMFIAQFGGAVATVLGALFGLWAILGIARLVSGAGAQRKVGKAIEDLTVDIGLKIVDLVRLPNSDLAAQVADRIGGRADGGRDCVPILRAEHAADLVIGVEMKGEKEGRGTLGAVELLAAALPRSPSRDLKAKVAAEITRCLDTYPAQVAPPMLTQKGARISALIFLVKPDGTFFELGAHLVRQGLALPNTDALSRALAATRGMGDELAEETLEHIRDAEVEAQCAGRGIWATGNPKGEEPVRDDGNFMDQDVFDRIMSDLDERDAREEAEIA